MSSKRSPPSWFPNITTLSFENNYVRRRPTYDLVVAVTDDDNIDWLRDVDDTKYRIFLYCKTSHNVSCPCKKYYIRYRPQLGSEMESFLYHICTNWWDMNEFVIFCTSDAMTKSPEFMYILRTESICQTEPAPLSIKLNEAIPPNTDGNVRKEPMALDMQPKNYACPQARSMLEEYRSLCTCSSHNILKHFTENLCGFAACKHPTNNESFFAHGAMISVPRSNITRHGIHPYIAMRDLVMLGNPFLEAARRVWLHIFF